MAYCWVAGCVLPFTAASVSCFNSCVLFSALFLMASVRLGLLGQIVSAVDGVVFDGLGLIHQLLALFAGVILDRGGLGLGVVGDGVGLLGGFIFNRRGFVLQLVCLRGGLFLISSAVAFALSVRSSAFSGRRLSSARRCLLALSVLASTLEESSQPATNNPIKEANSTLFHTFIVYILAETLLMVIAFCLPILGQVLLKLQI